MLVQYFLYTGTTDCTKTVKKIKHVYDKLTRLPIKSMLPQLYCNKVITEGQKKKIEAEKLESDGMQYFLDEVLILSLELDMAEIYCSFVKILEDSDDLIQRGMAKKIGECIIQMLLHTCHTASYMLALYDMDY